VERTDLAAQMPEPERKLAIKQALEHNKIMFAFRHVLHLSKTCDTDENMV
jgi:hypothetical protein